MPIRCLNTKIGLSYLELKGKDPGKVLKNFPYDKSYLMNPHNKISLEEELEFFRRCKIELEDENATFWMGAFSYYLGASAGALEPIIKYLGSPRGVVKSTVFLSRFFNDEISYKVENLNKNSAVIICTYGDHIEDPSVDVDGCKYTQGIYAGIPIIWDKTIVNGDTEQIEDISRLIKVEELYHASKELRHCKYELTIPPINLPRHIFRRTRSFIHFLTRAPDVIEQQDKELVESYENLRVAHEEVNRYSQNLERLVEERTQKLKKAQTQLIEIEKRTVEHRITGGFAHEMRNALAGAQLEFKTTLNYKEQGKPSAEILKESATNLLKNISLIHEKYSISKEEIVTLLLPELKTIAEIADHLNDIISDVSSDLDRGLSITTQIRDYAKMSEIQPGDEAVDIGLLLRSYRDRYKLDFERIGITYAVEGPETAAVKADEVHINSIFSNLILNAKDALEEVETDRPKEIKVTVEKREDESENSFIITVADNGSGIPEESLSEIFEPFYSTKPTTGTGLGLGVVKRLVQLYGGTIEVESKVGEETRFSVALPYRI
jgi:signal transduction histidine kinase